MISFSVTFSNVLLMLLYLLPGFFMCKVKKIKPEHLSSVSVILLYICGFGLYVNALSYLDPSPELFTKMGLFLLFALAGETALMLLILLLLGKKRRQEFSKRMLSIAAVMGNVGFFGMPVVRFSRTRLKQRFTPPCSTPPSTSWPGPSAFSPSPAKRSTFP